MATMANVLHEQSNKYERWVAEHWDELETWEREQYRDFVALVGNKRNRKLMTSTPDATSRREGRSWEEALLGPQVRERTVSLGYALWFVGIFFFPVFLESVAFAFGLINAGRRRWNHGMFQM